MMSGRSFFFLSIKVKTRNIHFAVNCYTYLYWSIVYSIIHRPDIKNGADFFPEYIDTADAEPPSFCL